MLKKITALLMAGGMAGVVGCAADTQDGEVYTTRALEQGLSCETNSGVNPMKAALAVAMSREIGRIDPVGDLTVVNHAVALNDGALARCNWRGFAGCPNTSAILGMQKSSVNHYVPHHIFNATTFREELKASFDRQRNHEKNLALNHPERLPGNHALRFASISDFGACGVHYDFWAWGEKIENIVERLEFFGGRFNPFIDYRSSGSTISIDPMATMNGDSEASSNECTLGCYAYDSALRDSCCACDGKQGIFRRAPWDRSMLYCAY